MTIFFGKTLNSRELIIFMIVLYCKITIQTKKKTLRTRFGNQFTTHCDFVGCRIYLEYMIRCANIDIRWVYFTTNGFSDDDSGSGQNFQIEYDLSANQTIYIGVKYYSPEKSGTISLNISKKVDRTFELDSTVISNNGRVTVSWTDSANNSPYTVAYQYVGNSNVAQPRYWAGGNEAGSTTYSKSFTIDKLIPGNSYRILVTDCNGMSIHHIYELPTPSTFVDVKLKASSIEVQILLRQKDSSASYSTASSIDVLRASDIISNRGNKEYGFRYDINYPKLAYSRRYFTQVAITAPNGYLECELGSDIQLETECSGVYWDMLGSWTFKRIYDENSLIPTGTWKVDLYWDGMHVNQSSFNVE